MNEHQLAEWETQIRIMSAKLKQARLLLQTREDVDLSCREAADILRCLATDAKMISDAMQIYAQ